MTFSFCLESGVSDHCRTGNSDHGTSTRELNIQFVSAHEMQCHCWKDNPLYLPWFIGKRMHWPLSLPRVEVGDQFQFSIRRKLADKVAAEGFLVVVPDFFYGEPYEFNNPKLDRQTWKKAHGVDKGYEDAKPVISALRSKGVTSIGAAGVCWGGVVVVKLARSDDIQAGVVIHPGHITEDDINEVKCPISILGAETDPVSPPEELKRYGDILSTKLGVDNFVKIFPGVNHGWSMRYDAGDESAVKSAEESHEDMLNWFTKYVK